MTKYFICTRAGKDGIHIVHREGCPFLPEPAKRLYLGIFHSPCNAVEEGRKYCTAAGSCLFCSKEHHRGNRKRALHETPVDECFISSGQMNDTPENAFVYSVN